MNYKFLSVLILLWLPLNSNTDTAKICKAETEHATVSPKQEITDQDIALLLLRRWEGLELESYWDVNAYRIGWGTKAKAEERISLEEANRRSEKAFLKVRHNTKTKYKNLDPWQVSVVSVMAYNVGNFGRQLDKALKEGDPKRIAEIMRRYVHSNGKKVQGLVNRRYDETRLLVSSPSERLQIAKELNEIVNKHIQKVQYG